MEAWRENKRLHPELYGSRKYDNSSNTPAKWTTQKLKDEARSYWSTIYEIECYGTRDLMGLELCMRELGRRGIEIVEGRRIQFKRTQTHE